jgi:hypothetical protein
LRKEILIVALKKDKNGREGADRPEMLENAPMQYAPQNELGVVFLFSHLAKRLRLKIEQIRPQYPDCIAYQKSGGREKKVRIEFEYRSRNFYAHQHKAKHCDWLVCWEHNWPGVPEHIRVVELRKLYGLGFNVWIQPVHSPYKERLWKLNSITWSVPSLAAEGDLILFYSTKPDACIQDIFRLTSGVRVGRAGWRKHVKEGKWTKPSDYYAEGRRVCRLASPLFLEDMRGDRILRTANFVRGSMQGRPNASEYWPYLYDRIVRRNSAVAARLKRYAPDVI